MNIFNEKFILYLHQYFHFPDEPGSIRSYTISKYFVNKGYKVIVLSLNNKSKNRFFRFENNIFCFYIPIKYSNKTPYLLRIIIFLIYTLISFIFILIIPMKIIYCTSTPLNVVIAPLVSSYFTSKKFLFEVRDIWPDVPFELGFVRNMLIMKIFNYLEILAYKKSKAIITLSVDMKKNILKKLEPQNKKFVKQRQSVLLIPNFSEHKIFINSEKCSWQKNKNLSFNDKNNILKLSNWKSKSNKPVLLYAGTMGFVNNPYLFIDLIKCIHAMPHIRLILSISGSFSNMVLKEIKNQDLLFNFPFSSKSVLPYIYQNADCGISFVRSIKCLFSNSANKYFDSLASGKPVLINHYGWQYKELIKNKCGFYLDQHNLLESYNNLSNLLNNKKLINEMSKNALALSKKYNSEKLLSKLNKYL